jgi:hypothetical protein
MKMVWHITGDSLDLDVLQEDLFRHYIENQKNHYHVIESHDVLVYLHDLCENLDIINQCLSSIKLDEISRPVDLSQHEMNRVHAQWVHLHRKYPRIADICRKFNPNALNAFFKTNKCLHRLEEAFVATIFNDGDPCYFHGSKIMSFGRSNVMLEYHNLGRTTINRWQNFATDQWDDTNDYDELWGMLNINLNRSFEHSAPTGYDFWCKKHKKEPIGNDILLANFRDLEKNLSTYRQVWAKNMAITDNHIFFTL